ncbi:MAG: type III pantothenate kinase, partial [Dehalococcoidia bacterium]|nr:type III pantothenate kinase [Dehalococcoidia bacterium]
DIGNTNVTLGVFKGQDLAALWRLRTEVHRTADEYAVLLRSLLASDNLSPSDIKEAVLASVVPPLISIFQDALGRHLGIQPLVVEVGIKTGVRICTDNPREVGADRICNTLAAYRLYGGPAIVIDFGTATTFDVVSEEGDYLGGAIAPGIELALEALFQHAAKLPSVELIRPKHAIGKNTVTSMQSGLIFGYVGLIEGILRRIKRELGGKARVIATGGLAETIVRETSMVEVTNPQLTLIGLRLIHELNRGQS